MLLVYQCDIYIYTLHVYYIYIYHEESTSTGSERAGLYLPALPALPVSLAPLG